MFVGQATFYRHTGKTSLYVLNMLVYFVYNQSFKAKTGVWFILGLYSRVGVRAAFADK